MKKSLLCISAVILSVFSVGCSESYFQPISNTLQQDISQPAVENTNNISEAKEFAEETVPPTEAINQNGFESFTQNIYVVGDSIASGYSAYERLPQNHVMAQQSANLTTITDIVFSSDYGDCYATDIIAYAQPEYLLLSVGLNEIGNRNPQAFAEKYRELAECFHAVSPDTIILISGMTPICYGYENQYIDNPNINEHNYELSINFNGEDNIYYVNPGAALQQDDGGLNPEYSGGDGIHLSGAAYDIMLEEIYKNIN